MINFSNPEAELNKILKNKKINKIYPLFNFYTVPQKQRNCKGTLPVNGYHHSVQESQEMYVLN